MVVSVGIDVSKDKHDCFIVSSEGEVLADAFIIPNTMDGFHYLLQRIRHCTAPQDKIKVGLEATPAVEAAAFSLLHRLSWLTQRTMHSTAQRKNS